MKLLRVAGFALLLIAPAITEEKPSDDAATLAASMTALPCFGQGDATTIHQCELRETARLFLIAGQRQAALRILCETTPALEVFRPQGPVAASKYEDNITANRRCLESVGIKE